ncbi:YggT family protein [Ligilactobacillus ceti]|uniref:YggT family protein n=1 Tax=Ligilactobacillus ceti TaxID=395085 RepID=UPI000489898E|nr:YggT family protein [Ligilactobacillus ceti]
MIYIVSQLFRAYTIALVIYVLMSWFPGAYQTKLGEFLGKIINPYLDLFNFIPPIANISFAPLVAIFALQFIQRGLIYLMVLLGLY